MSIQLANDNWSLSFSVDSYSKAETDALLVPKASESWVLATLGGYYTTQEANDAITAALATVDLSPFQNEAQVLALIAAALAPYDDSSQVDSKIITALLDFYMRAETDQAIADAASGVSVDLSAYFTSAQTQSYVANELLSFYPRTELDSLLTATLTQYWTSGPPKRRSTTPSPARASGLKPTLTCATSCALPAPSRGKSGTWFKNNLRPASWRCFRGCRLS